MWRASHCRHLIVMVKSYALNFCLRKFQTQTYFYLQCWNWQPEPKPSPHERIFKILSISITITLQEIYYALAPGAGIYRAFAKFAIYRENGHYLRNRANIFKLWLNVVLTWTIMFSMKWQNYMINFCCYTWKILTTVRINTFLTTLICTIINIRAVLQSCCHKTFTVK